MNEFAGATLRAEMREISPGIAADWIQYNYSNRPIQCANVNYLVNQMQTDNYVDGVGNISFSRFGRLINGQHTLQAIIMSESSQVCCVCYGLEEDAFEVFDTGKKRSIADALRINTSVAAICNVLWYFIKHSTKRPAPSEIKNIYDRIAEPMKLILEISDWQKRLSPAAIPAAFCVSWIIRPHDVDYMFKNLRWLAYDTEMTGTPPKVTQTWHAFIKTAPSNSGTGSYERLKIFLKALKIFDPNCRDVTRLYELDGAPLEAARECVRHYLFKEMANDRPMD